MRCCYDNNALNLIVIITTLASHIHLINAFLPPITKSSTTYLPTSSTKKRSTTSITNPPTTTIPFITTKRHLSPFDDTTDDDDDDDPYAEMKRQYPDLEFVDYSNPDYVVDQGLTDPPSSALSSDATEAAIEDMREDRRRRNDEYQFETYFSKTLNNGGDYRGEWTVYDVLPSDADDDEMSLPRLAKRSQPLTVTSSGRKVIVDPDAAWRVDGEVIVHEERVVKMSSRLLRRDEESDTLYVRDETSATEEEEDDDGVDLSLMTYWPERMTSRDFRGPMGNMVVGNAYTVCHGIPLFETDDETRGSGSSSGPYSQFRTEIGLHYDDLRFRVKLDYRTTTAPSGTTTTTTPPLLLSSLTVCRERQSPSPLPCPLTAPTFFSPPGAPGGLYDPPPVGSPDQSRRYTTVDLPGGATVLFPFRMDQDAESFGGQGWVVSLDWTPGPIRYQVDRKMEGGVDVKGIYRLELSEVRGEDADEYRPKDGGVDMRQ